MVAFYCLKDEHLFPQQRIFDDIVNGASFVSNVALIAPDVSAALQVSRFSLGIHATAKGLVVGRLKIKVSSRQAPRSSANKAQERDRWHDCAVSPYSISGCCESIPAVENCGSTLILVVEKHAAMLRLAEDRLWSKMPMVRDSCLIFAERALQILITAKGFPDMASRQFLCALVQTLDLPVYGLFDFNLGGYRVYDTWSRYRSVPEYTVILLQGLHSDGPRGVEIRNQNRLDRTAFC